MKSQHLSCPSTDKHAEESSDPSTNSTSGSDEEPPLDSPDAGEGTSLTDSTDTGGEDFFTDTDFTDTLDDISSDDSTVIDGALTVESDDLPEEPITVPPSNSNTLGKLVRQNVMCKNALLHEKLIEKNSYSGSGDKLSDIRILHSAVNFHVI